MEQGFTGSDCTFLQQVCIVGADSFTKEKNLFTPCWCEVVPSAVTFQLVNNTEFLHCLQSPEILLDFTLRHTSTVFGDCSLKLSRGLGTGRNSRKEGCSVWFMELIYLRSLGIMFWLYEKRCIYSSCIFCSWNIFVTLIASQNKKFGDRKAAVLLFWLFKLHAACFCGPGSVT